MTHAETKTLKKSIGIFLEEIVFNTLVDIRLKKGFEISEEGRVNQFHSNNENRYFGYYRGFETSMPKTILKFSLVDGTYTEIGDDQIRCLTTFKKDKTYSG